MSDVPRISNVVSVMVHEVAPFKSDGMGMTMVLSFWRVDVLYRFRVFGPENCCSTVVRISVLAVALKPKQPMVKDGRDHDSQELPCKTTVCARSADSSTVMLPWLAVIDGNKKESLGRVETSTSRHTRS